MTKNLSDSELEFQESDLKYLNTFKQLKTMINQKKKEIEPMFNTLDLLFSLVLELDKELLKEDNNYLKLFKDLQKMSKTNQKKFFTSEKIMSSVIEMSLIGIDEIYKKIHNKENFGTLTNEEIFNWSLKEPEELTLGQRIMKLNFHKKSDNQVVLKNTVHLVAVLVKDFNVKVDKYQALELAKVSNKNTISSKHKY